MDRGSPKGLPSYGPRLVIMAKQPIAGAVKSRLAGGGRGAKAGIGVAAATRFYRTALRHTVLRLATDQRWQTFLAISPAPTRLSACWPRVPSLSHIGQESGCLGARMQGLFDCLPKGPVIIVGSDIPAIRPAHIAEAFHCLGDADAVFGPAHDGGYWLVGLKRSPRRLAPFEGVPWSSARTLAATIENLRGARIALTHTLRDVDGRDDFHSERHKAERLIG